MYSLTPSKVISYGKLLYFAISSKSAEQSIYIIFLHILNICIASWALKKKNGEDNSIIKVFNLNTSITGIQKIQCEYNPNLHKNDIEIRQYT